MTRADYRVRLAEAYDSAPLKTMAMGADWYPLANRIAASIGRSYKLPTDRVAAAMSCLSVGVKWEKCIQSTVGICRAHHLCLDYPTTPAYGNQVKKAIALLNMPVGGTELLRHIAQPRALKTRNFYLNILRPKDPEPVTLDRWMWRLVEWNDPHYRVTAYRTYADAVRELAAEYGLLPNQLQAIVWLQTRNGGNNGS